MPLYQFINEKTGQIIDKVMSMNEDHKYIDETGYEWTRIWTIPQSSIDTVWNPDNPNDFIEKSGKKVGTLGDIMDKSAELSEARKQQHGNEDPIKRKHWDDYRALRGKDHPDER